MKDYILPLILVVMYAFIGCEPSDKKSSNFNKQSNFEETDYGFKQIVEEFSKEKLPENINSEFVLRLSSFLDMEEYKIDKMIEDSFPNMRIKGNETILYKDDHSTFYIAGKVRFISRVKVSDKPAIGFIAIHQTLAEDIMKLLITENFEQFGVGKTPEGTYIYRKNGYSIMIQYNDYHNIWSIKLHKYDI